MITGCTEYDYYVGYAIGIFMGILVAWAFRPNKKG